MKFSFIVGKEEKHEIKFSFNQFWGNVNLKIDNITKKKYFRMFSLKLTKTYAFEVGDKEKHNVVIEQIRKLLFAGLRKQKYRVLVDNNLLQEYEGF